MGVHLRRIGRAVFVGSIARTAVSQEVDQPVQELAFGAKSLIPKSKPLLRLSSYYAVAN